jgi:hypothetical protein
VGGKPPQRLDLPIADHPYFTFLPVWTAPGMLTGAEPTADFGTKEFHRFEFVPKHFKQALELTESDSVILYVPDFELDQDQFSRALAKIAYCESIRRYGLDGVDRTRIIDFILGRYPFSHHLVGGTIDTVLPPTPKRIEHAIFLVKAPIAGRDNVIAVVRLFSNTGTPTHGMPIYTVIVGDRLP